LRAITLAIVALLGPASLAGAPATGPSTADLGALPLPHLVNPRRIEGELSVTVANVQPFTGDRLAADNATLHLPTDKPPELHVWAPQIVERLAQRDVQIFECTPPPDSEYDDPVNQNHILHWDLTNALTAGNTITLRRRFAYTCYEIAYRIDPDRIAPGDPDSALHRFFTKSERLIEADSPEIRSLARSIVGGETNPLAKARLLFLWVCDHLDYHYDPSDQSGALNALRSRSGDCTQYSLLYVALCRAAGIPARIVAGFIFAESTGYHVWAEFYLPGYGWIPADASKADAEDGRHELGLYFAHLPNDRLVTSVGSNFPVAPSLPWARWSNSEIDQNITDLMQLWTQAGNGFDATFSSSLRVLRIDPVGTPPTRGADGQPSADSASLGGSARREASRIGR
jgi:hypothetical protein